MKNTSWENVATWYDGLVSDPDSYQAKVILPNLLRIVDPKPSLHIVELGSGQGFFLEACARSGATAIGLDASASLVKIAEKRVEKEHYGKNISFLVGDAQNASAIASKTADILLIILALQNMKDLSKVSGEIKRILKDDGRAVIVLNHPTFRVPKHSDWGFDEKTKMQYRMIDRYLSQFEASIDMNPGKTAKGAKENATPSFHRSLQDYMKAFSKEGLAITKIEEWISHRQSQKGPRQKAEDIARKEIPLFMCLELKKVR